MDGLKRQFFVFVVDLLSVTKNSLNDNPKGFLFNVGCYSFSL